MPQEQNGFTAGSKCGGKFDIIAITESWMDLYSKHFTTEFEIEGYNLFNFDRQGRRGRECRGGERAREKGDTGLRVRGEGV